MTFQPSISKVLQAQENTNTPVLHEKLCKVRLANSIIYLIPDIPLWFTTDDYGELIIDCILLQNLPDRGILRKLLHENSQISWSRGNEALVRIRRRLSWLLSRDVLSFDERQINCMVLELTNRCNFHCKHCFASRYKKEVNELPLDVVVRVIHEANELNVLNVALTGGEPFLRKDLFEILEAINNEEMSTLLLTNGSLVTEKIAKRLSKYNKLRIQVSLEGSRPEINDVIRGKGTFELALRGIKNLIREGSTVFLSCTILRPNLNDYIDFIHLASDLGVQRIRLGIPTRAGRLLQHPELVPNDEELVNYYIAVRNFIKNSTNYIRIGELESYVNRIAGNYKFTRCAGDKSFHISSKGVVSPCTNLIDSVFDEDEENVYKHSLFDIYKNARIFNFFRETVVDKIKICRNCPLKYICGGGCRGLAYQVYQDILSPDPNCTLHKELLLKLMAEVINYSNSPRNLAFSLEGGSNYASRKHSHN